jgi:hypothetical protein
MRNAILGSGEKDDALTRVAIATPTASFAGQFVYSCQQNLNTALVALDRIPYHADRAKAFDATPEDLAALIDACRDVEQSLQVAIARLMASA